LAAVRAAAVEMRYPLEVPGAPAAREAARHLVARIDDYLVPRLSRRDAALLVIVGGPTGAGKSTLVNSLVRAPVSRAGVLRPTTRAPVLVCHPDDTPWFSERPLLPGLARTSGLRVEPESLRMISAPGLPAGLALLDAPDVDSVVDTNRTLADQLLAAADLWLFVTTAARYADAVPWTVLRAARDRGIAVALVLNRVPAGAEDEVGGDFGTMLDEQGMGHVHLFVLPEVPLDGQGLLADRLVGPLGAWLAGLAMDPAARAAVIAETLSGALAGTDELLRRLAVAADDQVAAAAALHHDVRASYDAAADELERALAEGALLRGEVLAHCRELGAGRGRLPGEPMTEALGAALGNMIQEIALAADDRVRTAWHARPAGQALLAGADRDTGADLGQRAQELVREWRRQVSAAGGKPAAARLLLVLALLDGAPEVPRTLVAKQAAPELVERVRTDLLDRVRDLLSTEAGRYEALVDTAPVDPARAARLHDLARTISEEGPTDRRGSP
jgi:energy-coupling factor transporter ATP-binding protein EcfA2